MQTFLDDYDQGKRQGRYVDGELPSIIYVRVVTKVQLKITAIDHDHSFKIGSVPDGALPADKPDLVFTSDQECWQLKKGETTVIEFLPQTPG